jgi:molybdopterin/thiamine biosynthesis adenylyltransferase
MKGAQMDADQYYAQAFKRNLGLVTEEQQVQLRDAHVAVIGMGGLGGRHFLDLVRMGIGRFTIADIDDFSIVNINRQIGATSSTVGRLKADVMAEMAKDIHPGLELRVFNDGLQPDNARQVFEGVDVIVDAIDFFAMDARELLYRTAQELGIPVVFSAPLGFSGTLHVFAPGSMSFADYYDIREGMSYFEKLAAFAVGLAPSAMHVKYMDMSRVSLKDHAGPSISSACAIASGLLTTEVLVLLLGLRPAQRAPRFIQFDAFRMRYRRGKLILGNRGPFQRLKRWLVMRKFRHQAGEVT